MTPESKTRVIVITGASGGIGAATALALATPGCHLLLAARDRAALAAVAEAVRATGGSATVVPCDVTDEAQVQQVMGTSATISGQIDVLINCAGGAALGLVAELALEAWEHVLRANLTGTFLTCRYAVAHMEAGALIINVASVAARQAFAGWAAYCAAKAGVLALSNVLREELRPRGIRVAVVLPAATDTGLWARLAGDWNRAAMLQPADVARAIAYVVGQPRDLIVEELQVGHVAGRL